MTHPMFMDKQWEEMTNDDIFSLASPGLVAHALNSINYESDNDGFIGCCPVCCAPCTSLLILINSDTLSDAVRPYVQEVSDGWSWWVGDPDTGHVDYDMILNAWDQFPCTTSNEETDKQDSPCFTRVHLKSM